MFATAKSSFPSRLKSPITTELEPTPVTKFDVLIVSDETPVVTSKKAAFELPPPGVGLATVTEAVLGLAISEARIFAFNSELLTKIVVRALPFHLTTEPKIKPVPLTVTVNPAPPGLIASGTSGWLIRGIGFAVPVINQPLVPDAIKPGGAGFT